MKEENQTMSADGSGDSYKLANIEAISERAPEGFSVGDDAKSAALHVASYLQAIVTALAAKGFARQAIQTAANNLVTIEINVPTSIEDGLADYDTGSIVKKLRDQNEQARAALENVSPLATRDASAPMDKRAILRHAIQCARDAHFNRFEILEIVELGIQRSQKHDRGIHFGDETLHR